MDGLVIRPIVDSDMELLRAWFSEGTPEQPEDGLKLNREGTGDFLIACVLGKPVGYLALHWRQESHYPEAWKGEVAHLSRFIVLTNYRSRGIGTEMMRTAERMAAEKGFQRMSLGVGVDNEDARRLYERLGYRDAGLPPVTDGGTFRTWDGRVHEWRETWRFMIKELASG